MPFLGTYSSASIRGWSGIGAEGGGGGGWTLAGVINIGLGSIAYNNGVFIIGSDNGDTRYWSTNPSLGWNALINPTTFPNNRRSETIEIGTAVTYIYNGNPTLLFGLDPYYVFQSTLEVSAFTMTYENGAFDTYTEIQLDPNRSFYQSWPSVGVFKTVNNKFIYEYGGLIYVDRVSRSGFPLFDITYFDGGSSNYKWFGLESNGASLLSRAYQLAVKDNLNYLWSKTDVDTSTTWTRTTFSDTQQIYSFISSPNRIIVSCRLSNGSYVIKYSNNGTTWTNTPSPNNLYFRQLIYHRNQFWGILADGEIYSSYDGITWTYTDNNTGFIVGEDLNAYYIAPAGDNVVALASPSVPLGNPITYVQLI